jgi:nucleotide-binding universal stress UspA family protein
MSVHKILCPIDFSPGSEAAMRFAIRFARESDADLVLAHSCHIPPLLLASDQAFPAATIQDITDEAERMLGVATAEATKVAGKRIPSKLLNGPPTATIVDLLAEDRSFDLVVMGTHGRTGFQRFLLGSVAEKVVRHAPCSVLTVRNEPNPELPLFRNVVCPIDFSDSAKQALELAAKLVPTQAATVTLLHVLDLPIAYSGEPLAGSFVRDLDRRSAEVLAQWADQLRAKLPVPVVTRTVIGAPGPEIIQFLDHNPVDLVVVGSHGRTGLRRVLLGSVAEKLVRHANCPVLVARAR